MNLQATVALVIICLSAWSALALLLDRRGHARINKRYSLVIILFGVPQVYFYARLVEPPLEAALLGIAAQAAIWLKGPLLLSMTRLAVDRPMRALWRHFLPFPFALAGMLSTPGWDLEWGMAGFCALLTYLVIALLELRRARPRLALIYSAYPNSAYYWLLYVVAGLLVLVSMDLVLMAVAYSRRAFPLEFMKGANWLVGSYLVVVAFFSVYRPQVFFHEDRASEPMPAPAEPETAPVAAAEPADSRAWRELDASIAQSLSSRLVQLMEQDQLYRQHDLSLADLARHLGISVHQTSELLNVQHRASFYEYLNGYRLRYACDLLADPRCELRVLDIAFESGFGNKNTFYRSFRDAYDMTPVEYRRRQLAGGGARTAATLGAQSQNPS